MDNFLLVVGSTIYPFDMANEEDRNRIGIDDDSGILTLDNNDVDDVYRSDEGANPTGGIQFGRVDAKVFIGIFNSYKDEEEESNG